MDVKPTVGIPHGGMTRTAQFLVLGVAGGVLLAAGVAGPRLYHWAAPDAATGQAATLAQPANAFKPTPQQLASLTLQPVTEANFRAERTADGKIALDDDLSTPVYPPYSGRVTRVFVKAGDHVERGAPLFEMESTDLVQAQNDFISASAALGKARSQVSLLGVVARRQQALLAVQGAAQKDVEQAQADLTGAQNDQHSAEIALAAVRDRLRILGVTDQAMQQLNTTRRTDPQLMETSPIAGTVTLRKLGQGQYLSSGATDPVITIGDLAKVWLVANVRESDAALVAIGDAVDVHVTAYPDRVFKATISYVAASVDPSTHRLPIRAEVENPEGLLKPEMFADFTIAVSPPHKGLAIPQEAVVYEGDAARVWVERPDSSIVSHPIKIGITNGAAVEALSGIAVGDKVVTSGSLFVDHAASED